jgi:hypothetical protein
MRFELYPIHWVADPHLDPEPFDHGLLPFDVAEGVRIEAVAGRFNEGVFDLHRNNLGNKVIEVLESVRYGIVHRYDPEPIVIDGEVAAEVQHSQSSERLVREVVACLRLIRPMRQHALMMRGTVREEDGSFEVTGFDVPNLYLHEVPEVQKLWHLRNRDCHDLRRYAPAFLRAMRGEFWKFRMAVQFHDLGYYESLPDQWKARLLLWASAIESIYTTSSREHQGTAVATERIKWMLGRDTSVYAPGDLSEFEEDPHLTVAQIVDALYNVRNFVAHGDRIPDTYFSNRVRNGMNGSGMFMDVLFEAQSFIIRTTLLKILRDGLLDHFATAAASEAYFDANGLTNSQIRARERANARP